MQIHTTCLGIPILEKRTETGKQEVQINDFMLSIRRGFATTCEKSPSVHLKKEKEK